VQLVTLVGEPGVGKTRLLRELGRWLDDQDDLVYWRQGRCLPYGEGITFWALGELVKAHAGILESDSPEQAADKLAVAVQIVDDAEREWVRARLAPLVGAADAASASREESFTAWRTFLDAIAAERPLVVLVEDIHWADASLLEFLGDVLDWSNGVPLLVLCTGRPELYDRHPGWGGGKRNSTTVSLAPLSRDETAHLVAALLERSVLPADTQAALLERAGGNPLYAEEFARMFADRGELGEDTPVPETVQALIAARIDTLAPDAKALVHDAAVVGKVFWAGAVAALAGRESADVLEPLNQLVRKELIRPARTSSMEGEREYTFWHALVRDVAYGQIPRGARARKHAAAGAWIEGSVGERASDQAELLAHHYGEALRLTRAADADADTAELQRTAARFLALAGERAMKLDVARAAAYLEEALALWPEDDPAQLDVVVKLSGAQMMDGRPGEALATGERALAAWRDRGDPTLVGGLISSLGAINFNIAQLDESGRLAQEAVLLLEGQPPSPQLVVAYSRLAAREMLLDRPDASIALCRKAIGLAEQLGVPEAPVNLARQMLGSARLAAGDPGGLADVVDALNRALDQGLSLAGPAYVNVAFARWWLEGSQPGIDVYRQGIEMAERRGLVTNARWARAEGLWPLYDLGEWDEILAEIDAILADETASDSQLPAMTLPVVARILAHRGDLDRAAALVGDFLPRARTIGISQVVGLAFPAAGFVALARGDHAGASGILREFAGLSKGRRMQRAMYLTESARVAVAIGERDLAAALIENLNPGGARVGHGLATVEAILAEADGETERAGGLYRAAAALWEDYGSVVERGYALLGAGRCDGNATDLREARAIFSRLGAAALVAEADALLGDATASSA
jgi:tetratricopeptide (TPR) repeat protein